MSEETQENLQEQAEGQAPEAPEATEPQPAVLATEQATPTPSIDEEDPLPTARDFEESSPNNINPEVLKNITVNLSIEVGRTQIKIKDLMRLTQGSVVELDRIAGEPLDLLVNNTVVAQGEVVLVNDRYGIRLTRVVPSTERLKSL
jgi:flagellar motor switch protein FliN/FliY